MKHLINKILTRLGIYNKTQVLAGFEFGLILADVVQQQKIDITQEQVKRIEEIMLSEMSVLTPKEFILNTLPLMLAVIQEISPDQKDIEE